MRPHLIREAIDQYARRGMSRPTDLWPAVQQAISQQAPPRPGIHIEAAGPRAGGLLPVALLAGIVLAALLLWPLLPQLPQFGSPPGPDVVNPTVPPAGTPLADDPAKVPATPPADNPTKPHATPPGDAVATASTIGMPTGDPISDAIMAAVKQGIARRLGMDDQAFAAALIGGQSLQSLEQAHNVSHQQVRDAALAAAQTALQEGVQHGQWTQAEAEVATNSLQKTVDMIVVKLQGATPADDPAKRHATPPPDDPAKVQDPPPAGTPSK